MVTNYLKTPWRGVKEWEIQIDDFIVYQGYMKKWGKELILFSDDEVILNHRDFSIASQSSFLLNQMSATEIVKQVEVNNDLNEKVKQSHLEDLVYIPTEDDLVAYISSENETRNNKFDASYCNAMGGKKITKAILSQRPLTAMFE